MRASTRYNLILAILVLALNALTAGFMIKRNPKAALPSLGGSMLPFLMLLVFNVLRYAARTFYSVKLFLAWLGIEQACIRNDPNYQNKLHLLGLPAEIRNAIMDYVLLSNRTVFIHPHRLHQPAILKTCLMLRNDYIREFYGRNRFVLQVRDYDVIPFVPLYRGIVSAGLDLENFEFRISGRPSWATLKMWARQRHERRFFGIPLCVNTCDDGSFAEGLLFNVAFVLRGLSWSETERLLDAMRSLLIRADERWAD